MVYRYDIGLYYRRICVIFGLAALSMNLNWFTINAVWAYVVILIVAALFSIAQALGIRNGAPLSVVITEESFTLKIKEEGYAVDWSDVKSVSIDEHKYVYIKYTGGMAPISGYMENIDQMIDQIKEICSKRGISVRKAVVLT